MSDSEVHALSPTQHCQAWLWQTRQSPALEECLTSGTGEKAEHTVCGRGEVGSAAAGKIDELLTWVFISIISMLIFKLLELSRIADIVHTQTEGQNVLENHMEIVQDHYPPCTHQLLLWHNSSFFQSF